MATEKRKIGSTEIEWDIELGGPVVSFPKELQPAQPAPKPKETKPAKSEQ